jgi:formate dehydrogenase gamma subunit
VIVPLFLLYKRGGREAIEEVRLGRDDLVWMLRKPLVMLRLAREPLPPQHKYNAGQKIFAITAILGTATIIATGLVMAFHLGSATMVVAAILIHKLAVGFAIAGLGVHLTMAAVIREERPALRSMIGGTIDRAHAEEHNRLWVEQHDTEKR